jgi:hypothetical protein
MGPIGDQKTWFDLRDQHGEAVVRKALVAKLRAAADAIETASISNGGDVFGCQIENAEPRLYANGFIERISVTMSLPWPG